jgi:hypothetical protein
VLGADRSAPMSWPVFSIVIETGIHTSGFENASDTASTFLDRFCSRSCTDLLVSN